MLSFFVDPIDILIVRDEETRGEREREMVNKMLQKTLVEFWKIVVDVLCLRSSTHNMNIPCGSK